MRLLTCFALLYNYVVRVIIYQQDVFSSIKKIRNKIKTRNMNQYNYNKVIMNDIIIQYKFLFFIINL